MAQGLLSFNEPIPDFSTRTPNILESCLATPFQTFGGKFLYPGFLTRAGMLFYFMIKNHPFENGNKRIAITTLFTFLFANNKWLIADIQELYNFTVWVAQSPPQFKDEVVKAIEKFFKTHIKEIKNLSVKDRI
jgi:death-on-curing protein